MPNFLKRKRLKEPWTLKIKINPLYVLLKKIEHPAAVDVQFLFYLGACAFPKVQPISLLKVSDLYELSKRNLPWQLLHKT